MDTAIIRRSKRQLEAMIDRDARRRLGMSGARFRKRWLAGSLPDDCGTTEGRVVRDIRMLMRLISK